MQPSLPPNSSSAVRPGRVALRLIGVVAVLVAVAAGAGFWVYNAQQKPTPVAQPPGGKPTTLTGVDNVKVGGVKMFDTWPKEKPDLVIVVSGQMYGYLSPCGCSRPQLGGLERRYNLIQELKGKGWEVIGVDVGEIAPTNKGLHQQNLKKYGYAMRALKEMGYVAVGVGKTEFQNDLWDLLGQFTVNNPNERPIILSGNIAGGVERDKDKKPTKATAREEYFKVKDARPLVEDVEVYKGKSVSVGVVGMTAPTVANGVVNIDAKFDFEKVSDRLPEALKKVSAAKSDLKVLLYQGSEIEAMQVAKDFPEIGLIVRASDDSEGLPPMLSTPFPDASNPRTQIVQVGHKGQNVGLIGVFKTAKGISLRYQLVPLGEEYLTPEKVESKDHALLSMMEKYTTEVMKDDLLKASVKERKDHPSQAKVKGLTYVGAEVCAKCHQAEMKKWGETKHAHAYEALEKIAKRPSLRQFDPDCVVCHTTGFNYNTGFESEKTTPKLLHNQCENCHGPGSAHAAKPAKGDFELLTPWKSEQGDKLDKALLDKMAALPESKRGQEQVPVAQRRLINQIQGMCMNCHDLDNDPHFDIWTYLPKIYHSGLKNQDLPDGIGK